MADAGIEKPDTEAMLETLKPFQRDTVEYVFQRMYTDPDCTRRFLVADEVGLGKTMVARGVIARAIDHLQEQVDRVDIVYICSNGDIARQNLQRLNLTEDKGAANVGRLTMLPATLPHLDASLNFVAFTPGTSFNMGSSSGKWEERALLFWMLDALDRLPANPRGRVLGQGGPQLFQSGLSSLKDWKRRLASRWLPGIGEVRVEQTLLDRFEATLQEESDRALEEGRSDLQARIEAACAAFKGRNPHNASAELRAEASAITGELRVLLARSCLSALEPDLVILDEFQRFKELLDPENEAGSLAHDLFDYTDEHTAVRTLLLSATPYKMYTLHSEREEDDHYRDFMDTLRFLFADDHRTAEVAGLLKRMRHSLYRIPSTGPDEAIACRGELEARLRQVMVRTERARGVDTGDDMVHEVAATQPPISSTDAGRYLALQRMVRTVNGPDMIEYWKSAPYLLNFMDEYQVKKSLRQTIEVGGNAALGAELRRNGSLLLSETAITGYEAVDPGSGRLRMLIDNILEQGQWRMLWMPPCLPPYRLRGPYADASGTEITKRLIFSAWHVVPKTVAGLVSYEIERRLHTRFDAEAENTQEARERESRLLRFDRRDGRLAGLPLFTLLYPSSVLARIGGQALVAAAQEDSDESALERVLHHAEASIRAMLPDEIDLSAEGRADEAWYWVTPILLDLEAEPERSWAWWDRQDLAYQWARDEREASAFGWREHLEHAWAIVNGERPAGPPPGDLTRLLAEVAVAGPATGALRSLRSVSGYTDTDTPLWLRDGAARIGWSYRRLFNQIESTVLIRGEYADGARRPYWRQILQYALDGGLCAVNDEYLHVLADATAAQSREPESACERVVEALEEGVALPPSRVQWDEIGLDGAEPALKGRRNMRTHFAARFGKAESDDGSSVTREDQVRAAFNSPFWPFVLTSTSVGQEGLDFHPYCHAIIHWNLPGNPVDMEQREGRIHRYRGHAVRKNVARHYSFVGRTADDGDSWDAMFDHARAEYGDRGRGLVPDWNYPVEGGARIERHVPVLPFSRDSQKYENLRKSLAAYRMVFGQARQEDLVAYLIQHVGPEQIEGLSGQLRIDLSPRRETVDAYA